ncbi:hypothetical protein UPYG_G00122050 [Umbra pygmaea]|uniref:Uncharacterized protein n=1 Tax=Umbra pygmaea TaxID=75934 RepID=A0ABD0X582_UMBPY
MTKNKRSRLDSGSVYETESDEPSSQIVLEIPDSDVVKTISQYFDASFNGQNSTLPVIDHVSSAQSDSSDSGDSLFLTQAVVPVAVRSVRRYHTEDLTCSTELEDGSAPSPRRSPRRKPKKSGSKKYSFSLLERVYRNEQLSNQKRSYKNSHLPKSLIIATSAIGGFFKCVKTRKKLTKAKKIPASASAERCLDEKGGLSPLSEHEDESNGSDDDIRVVKKDLFTPFVVKKNRQQWCHPSTNATKDFSKAHKDSHHHNKKQSTEKTLHTPCVTQTPSLFSKNQDITSKQSVPGSFQSIPEKCNIAKKRTNPTSISSVRRHSSHHNLVHIETGADDPGMQFADNADGQKENDNSGISPNKKVQEVIGGCSVRTAVGRAINPCVTIGHHNQMKETKAGSGVKSHKLPRTGLEITKEHRGEERKRKKKKQKTDRKKEN